MTAAQKKGLGLLQLWALGINGIVGVGIFFAPAKIAHFLSGWHGPLAFVVVLLLLLPVALTFARLASRFGESGGPVLYAEKAFGKRAAFFVGWVAYVSSITSTAAILQGLCKAIGLGGLWLRPATIGVLAVLSLICLSGLRLSAHVWTGFSFAKLLPLLGLVGLGWMAYQRLPAPSPPAPVELSSWGRGALLVVFAYQGFEVIPLLAGDAKDPKKAAPRAIFLSLGGVGLLYLGLMGFLVRALPGLANTPAPVAKAAEVVFGSQAGSLVGWLTSLSALGIAFGMVATTPHYLVALAKTSPRPSVFAQVNRRRVPLQALGLSLLLLTLVLLAGDFGESLALSSAAVLCQYGAAATACVVMAIRSQHGLAWPDALVGLLAGFTSLVLASAASLREVILAVALLAVGAVLRALGALLAHGAAVAACDARHHDRSKSVGI